MARAWHALFCLQIWSGFVIIFLPFCLLFILVFAMEPLNVFLANENGLLTRMVDQLRTELNDQAVQLEWLDNRAEYMAEELLRMRQNYVQLQQYCQNIERQLLLARAIDLTVDTDSSDSDMSDMDLLDIIP